MLAGRPKWLRPQPSSLKHRGSNNFITIFITASDGSRNWPFQARAKHLNIRMTDNTLFAGHQPKGRRQRQPGERLWTMTKGGEAAWAELRQRVAGVELRLFRGDDFATGGCTRPEWADGSSWSCVSGLPPIR